MDSTRKSVVLDTCAFVRRAALHPDADYCTTQSVVDELVDEQSLQYFHHAIVPIEIRAPSSEAIQKGKITTITKFHDGKH